MKTLFSLLRLVWLPMMLSILCSWGSSLSAAALMAASAYIITSAALKPPLYTLSMAITAVRFFGISRALLRYLERYLSHDASFRLLGLLRAFAYKQLESRIPLKLQASSQGIFLNHLINDIDVLKDFYLRVFSPISSAFLMLLTLCIVLSFYSRNSVFLLVLAFAVCLAIPITAYLRQKKNQASLDLAISSYKDACIDAWLGLADIKASGSEASQSAHLQSAAHAITQKRLTSNKQINISDHIAASFCSAALLAIFACLIPVVRSNELSGITLAVLLLTIQSGFETFALLPEACRSLQAAHQTGQHFFEEKPPHTSTELTASPLNEKNIETSLLAAQNVCFSYDESRLILKNISFSIKPGEKVAIIGASGSGKSTLFHLLLHLWQGQSGSLLWEGQNYDCISPEKLRQDIRAITQNTYIFTGTIRTNFTKIYPQITDEEIFAALKKAQLDEFIQSSELLLNRPVGENGRLLSGGQRQRLGIARALAQPAKLLLLDEPTAGLDSKTADNFMQTLLKNQKGSAMLLITHDEHLLKYMDRILLLQEGVLTEYK